ncbi:myosin-J heavy chain-like [Argiope bruennichi]|uniref:myosin-J heavy chain-like n=1 Tax=Argiope bruennichi TaxID=94029 RepID=UPI002495841E|nr:myosin-J heavy chain-like [Argiope bruennichi]
MADLHRESLLKLTVAALKDELFSRNLPTSGLKDDLIERLREALEREQSCGGISDNVGETNELSKKAAEEKQKEESALEDKLTQLLSFMTEMKAGQVEMKTEMKAGQVEMKAGQAEMKSEMKEINNAVKVANARVEEFEGRLEEMEKKFEKLKQEMEVQVTEESRESYETPQEFRLAAANQSQNARYMPVVNRPCMKLLPYDGQTSWQVYKTQFAIVAEANGWDPITKARQLASSLRAEAADILRTIPDNEQLNFDALSSALELRFGEKCLKDYSRLQLKTRQQKPNETLQDLATDIEKLSHLAFSDCPTEVRETLAVQYFVDGVRDVEIQKALRMAETKDLKSGLVYAIKFEAAQQASRRDRHFIRGAEVKRDEDPLLKVMTQLLEEFRGMKQRSGEETGKFKRNNARCWKCGAEGHLQRQCQARQDQRPRSLSRNNTQEN